MDTPALNLARHREAANLPVRPSWGALSLSVTDLDRARAFWTTVPGFMPRPVARGHAGMSHVAFGMPSQAESGGSWTCASRSRRSIT